MKTTENNNNLTPESGVRQVELGVSSALDTSKVRDEGLYRADLSWFPQIKPSNYMKASVQLPPYKSPGGLSYDQWRRSASPAASPLEVRTHTGPGDSGVRTRVEHFTDSQRQSSGTRTVTRTITPAGEMAVYASQSSVRFKMTSRSSKQQSSSVNRDRARKEEGDSDEEARDLYPVTTLRSHSMREADQSLTRSQCLPSPDFNIVHRDTEHTLEVGDTVTGARGEKSSSITFQEDDYRESSTAPQQGYAVVVAIDFGQETFSLTIHYVRLNFNFRHNLQWVRLQLHSRPGGHPHHEEVGGRRPGHQQPEDPHRAPPHPGAGVPLIRIHGQGLLP